MKQIEAIIRTSKFDDVKEALHKIDIDFFSYWDAVGVGNEKNRGERVYRGTVYDTEYISRRILNIVVRDINLRKTIDCLLDVGYTGEIGDGMIFVTTIDESWRIRDRVSGDDSLYNKD
ncbi:MAG: P-II family nitrogen regulator [Desulfobulbaceae bacterium]|jgi:nitrogen regulatory protein P-II 1|nr:P-II family nitrogen regulator [Desulfobulbaceae bacterium]